MRIFTALLFVLSFAYRSEACSCETPGLPCYAAGRSAAAFTGTVVDIRMIPAQIPPAAPGPVPDRGLMSADVRFRPVPGYRMIRLQVHEALSGVAPGQREVEVSAGLGSCEFPFELGSTYVVYARKNVEDRLEAGQCTRTAPIAKAAEDLKYFRAMANAPNTSRLRVHTGYPGLPAKRDANVVIVGQGSRITANTNGGGQATFTGILPGEYRVHLEADGDLPDDPTVRLYPKGCVDVSLRRRLRIIE